MSIEPGRHGIDWDGLFTFLLSLLLLVLALGLPLIFAYFHAMRIAMTSTCDEQADSSLLVFGKRLINTKIDQDYRLRLDKAAQLIANNPARNVILLGGSPCQDCLSEAMAGLTYLATKGLASHSNILLEEGSRNTLENLRQARKMLNSTAASPALLITNRYHLARVRMIADSLGIKTALCPAEISFSFTASGMAKLAFEAYYLLWFRVGKAWARLTGNARMLRRVT